MANSSSWQEVEVFAGDVRVACKPFTNRRKAFAFARNESKAYVSGATAYVQGRTMQDMAEYRDGKRVK